MNRSVYVSVNMCACLCPCCTRCRSTSDAQTTNHFVCVQVLLMSPDENTILVVSYADLKACCERSFMELLSSGNYSNNQLNRQYMQQQMSGSPFQQPMDWGISVTPPPSRSLSISLSQTHAHTYSHPQSHPHSHSHSHSHSH